MNGNLYEHRIEIKIWCVYPFKMRERAREREGLDQIVTTPPPSSHASRIQIFQGLTRIDSELGKIVDCDFFPIILCMMSGRQDVSKNRL